MKLKQLFEGVRNGGKMRKWSDVKKELNLSENDLRLAKAKLELSELICDGEENLTVETIVKLLAALQISLRLKPEKLKSHESVLRIAA